MSDQKPQIISDRCWITDDNSQGQGDVIIFDESDLTEQQWEIFNELPESKLFLFVQAVIKGDDLSDWESD